MRIKAYIIGNAPEGAMPVMQYSTASEGGTPQTEDVDESTEDFDLKLADGTISAEDAKLLEHYSAGKTVKYRFGIRIGEDTYWGAEKQFGPSEPAYELYHAVETTAKTSGSVNILLLHPLRAGLDVVFTLNGGAPRTLTRDSDIKFKASGLTITAGQTFTYSVVQPAHDDVPETVLYQSLPFNVTT